MEVAKYLVHDKGTHVCQVCFHKRYSKRKWTNNNYQYKKYTMQDVKKHLEKDWDWSLTDLNQCIHTVLVVESR